MRRVRIAPRARAQARAAVAPTLHRSRAAVRRSRNAGSGPSERGEAALGLLLALQRALFLRGPERLLLGLLLLSIHAFAHRGLRRGYPPAGYCCASKDTPARKRRAHRSPDLPHDGGHREN